MSKQSPVDVDLEAFCQAAQQIPKMRRSPAGSQGRVPKDTVISPCADGLSVDTPVMSTVVQCRRKWRRQIAVDARRLLQICEIFLEARISTDVPSTLTLSVRSNSLVLSDGSLKVSIPILESR